MEDPSLCWNEGPFAVDFKPLKSIAPEKKGKKSPRGEPGAGRVFMRSIGLLKEEASGGWGDARINRCQCHAFFVAYGRKPVLHCTIKKNEARGGSSRPRLSNIAGTSNFQVNGSRWCTRSAPRSRKQDARMATLRVLTDVPNVSARKAFAYRCQINEFL